jgi:hypothetical protein
MKKSKFELEALFDEAASGAEREKTLSGTELCNRPRRSVRRVAYPRAALLWLQLHFRPTAVAIHDLICEISTHNCFKNSCRRNFISNAM